MMKPFACLALLMGGINVEATVTPMQHGGKPMMDKETFTQLVQRQQRQMYRIALSYTASSADAEDAMQDALLRAWNRRDTLRDISLFGTWLNRILINECKTLLRGRRRQTVMDDLPDIAVPPPDEGSMALRTALFALPEKYRIPLVLHLLEGYTLPETAALLKLPLGTVKTRVARARKKLEEEVSEHAQ